MSFPEYVAVAMAERQRTAEIDRLARFAAAVRACCQPSRITRVLAAMRATPVRCGC